MRIIFPSNFRYPYFCYAVNRKRTEITEILNSSLVGRPTKQGTRLRDIGQAGVRVKRSGAAVPDLVSGPAGCLTQPAVCRTARGLLSSLLRAVSDEM